VVLAGTQVLDINAILTPLKAEVLRLIPISTHRRRGTYIPGLYQGIGNRARQESIRTTQPRGALSTANSRVFFNIDLTRFIYDNPEITLLGR
jgi:hypothetical protein